MSRDTAGFLDNLFGLQGKTAVVVGGTGVLCGTMAKGLWSAGCRVLLVGRNQGQGRGASSRLGSSGRGSGVLQGRSHGQIPRWKLPWPTRSSVSAARISGSTARASIPRTPYLDISEEEFGRILDNNIKSVHLGCQIIGKHWLDNKLTGNIINMSSMSALRPLSRVFTYSVTKAAVWNLTQNLAREWAPNGIRVNALCPGFFPAEQNRKVLDKERIASIMRLTPMDRFGEAEELLGATLLLASDKAAGFITGAHLVVDGGFSVTTI